MKLNDYIHQMIVKYPRLYAGNSFEESKIQILDQLFLTLGNGLHWAKTDSPKTGGYLTERRYKRKQGEWETLPDLPYGKEKFNCPEIDRYFTEPYVEVQVLVGQHGDSLYKRTSIGHEKKLIFSGFLKDCPDEIIKDSICHGYDFDTETGEYFLLPFRDFLRDATLNSIKHLFNLENPKYCIDEISHKEWLKQEYIIEAGYGQKPLIPYPFSTRYWALAKIDPENIQTDWLEGMIQVKETALVYYQDVKIDDKEVLVRNTVKIWADDLKAHLSSDKELLEYLTDRNFSFDDFPSYKHYDIKTSLKKLDKIANDIRKFSFERDRIERIDALEKALNTLKPILERRNGII